ncbi:PEP/pyruvate-binding domain-containing protein [Arthrobacter sp. USHLN218]|uniref:PEP/pyruvate-binding domain-containing protein n=1 Tax=Arthrobacter sp. USHLN218 TaxID=3081232 RepID=UPI003015D493
MGEELTAPLADFGAADVAAAGGKGANLGELVRGGFPVPPGFVVSTAAYRLLLKETGLGGELVRLLEAGAASGSPGTARPGPDGTAAGRAGQAVTGPDGASIRDLFAGTGMPDRLRAAIIAAYRELGGGPVAVRSSATAEDLPGAAFAGQQDTFLDVDGERAVLRAVAGCWASLWTDRAMAYRNRNGIDPHQVGIAVVIQRMVRAEAAGVLFTANPLTGRRGELVVEAAAGLGEAVVSGALTPDNYVLDVHGALLRFTPGQGGAVLVPAQLAGLASLAGRVQELFKRPQDIEWALAEGRLHLLQARPMTALPPEPPRLNRLQRMVGPFFMEMFQQRPYPLDVSGWMQHGIGAMLERMAGSVGARFPPLPRLLPEEDGVVVQLILPVPRPTLRMLGAPLSVLRRARRFDAAQWTEDPRFAAFLAEIGRLRAGELAALPVRALLAAAEEALSAMSLITELRVSYLPSAFLPLGRLRLLLALLGAGRLGPALIAGAETRTSQANRGLEALAEQVNARPDLAQAFRGLEPARLLVRLRQDPEFAGFREALDAFLAEYGHRETVSIVLSSAPTWAEAPEVVLGLVRSMLGERPAARDQSEEALARLWRHPAMRFAPLRRAVQRAVAEAKCGIAFRENTHFYATMVLPVLRRAYAELGRRLAGAGVLADPAEVYHLRFGELGELVRQADDGGALPPTVAESYRSVVRARAAKRRELQGVPLLDPVVLFARRRPPSGVLVTGTGASRGQAAGRVRLVRGPEEFGLLRSGEILVCPYTNPSWTPLFRRAAAVVVDLGGLGSHAAIVAREYGIPAVMGTGNGTAVLRDGQYILVDGNRGTVTAG